LALPLTGGTGGRADAYIGRLQLAAVRVRGHVCEAGLMY
jgi:hypothetical protein